MKTHLPHGLRAALMAALAAVSLTAGHAATADYSINWDNIEFTTSDATSAIGTFYVPTNDIHNIAYNGLTVVDSPDGSPASICIIGSDTYEFNQSGDYHIKLNGAQAATVYGVRSTVWEIEPPDLNVYCLISGDNNRHSSFDTVSGALFARVNGDIYMELADPGATYTGGTEGCSVCGVSESSDISGSCTTVIRGGTFNGSVVGGALHGWGTIAGGTYLQIDGGTFKKDVIAGDADFSLGIKGGTHLLIKDGSFEGDIYGGSICDQIEGGVSMQIEDGTFQGKVYGGNSFREIKGDLDITISGGTFESDIYALGIDGFLQGRAYLTISGDAAKFGDDCTISAGGAGNASIDNWSTVTLKNITNESDFAKKVSLNLDGGGRFMSELAMENVRATIQAKLSNFGGLDLKEGSDVTLTQATNEKFGDAGSICIRSGSTLNLMNKEGETWYSTILFGSGVLKKTGAGTLVLHDAAYEFDGHLQVEEGTLKVTGTKTHGTSVPEMRVSSLSGSGTLYKTGTPDLLAKDASQFTGEIMIDYGTMVLENVNLATPQGRKITIKGGDHAFVNSTILNLLSVKDGNDAVVKELSINGGTLGVYLDGSIGATINPNALHAGTLTLAAGSRIVIGEYGGRLDCTLKANRGSILDFSAGTPLYELLDLNVADGAVVLLSDEEFYSLKNGDSITLVEYIHNDFNPDMIASDLIVCRGAERLETLAARFSLYSEQGSAWWTAKLCIVDSESVPEPTTGTLSLLALASLCARRRRKD